MRLAFFGSSDLSCIVLKALLDSPHEVVAAVTQPDQPAGRRMQLCPTRICTDAEELGLPVLKPERVRSNPAFRAELQSLRPEAFVTASYGQIISKKVLALTEWPLNVHPSMLPKLRGASPVRTALLQGLAETGCCIMRMTPKLDDGDVLVCERLAIEPQCNHRQLETALGELGGRLVLRALEAIERGVAVLTPQDHARATYCKIYTREDTVLDWRRPAGELLDFIRAWDPDIGALTSLPGGRKLKIWRSAIDVPPEAAAQPEAPLEPGMISGVTKKCLWVAAGQGHLRLLELQPENKSRMPAASFLAGNQLNPGERLGV